MPSNRQLQSFAIGCHICSCMHSCYVQPLHLSIIKVNSHQQRHLSTDRESGPWYVRTTALVARVSWLYKLATKLLYAETRNNI
uniref:Uncharacterized protein n=1 Tax=Meloidogyne incognita TaxID=6306 RepID=A0A914NBW4_MELIC